MDTNPYQPPQAEATAPPFDPSSGSEVARPPYKLYAVGHVVLATFLGSPAAGGVILAINYARLDRPTAAMHALVWSVVATVLLMVALTVMPDVRIPNLAYLAPQLIVMYLVAQNLQERLIREHRQRLGRMASGWAAAGIGLGIGILVAVAYFLLLSAALIAFPEIFPGELANDAPFG